MLENSQSLINEFNKGGKVAFKQIFDQYYTNLCLFTNKYIEDFSDSEDIAQEVFIILWEKRTDFSNMYSLKAFIYQTAKNKALNLIKHSKVKFNYSKAQIIELESEQYFANQFIEEETKRIIIQRINELPAQSRKIILLSMEGMKNQEIAETMDISINTVKTQKKIAYKKLKSQLAELFSIIAFCFF
jgi:RNA polymerase sigma-70 factor (family 1)